jgi:S-adenosyl-L-methionine hydrolase (adenosine-forming)
VHAVRSANIACAPMPSPPISFLSDYGHADEFVGVCHAVIATICPDADVIDITHGISRHDVRAGAMILRAAMPYLPAGVVLAVVDPDVGAERRAVAIRGADGRLLVGPDNGLLSLAQQLSGGAAEAVDIARSPFRLEPVSATFHGRDIFAPVAARLAAGVALAECGEPLDPSRLVRLELPAPRFEDATLVVRAVYVDRFGNVALGVDHDELAGSGLKLGRPASIELADHTRRDAQYALTFADVAGGELLLYEDSSRRLALAVCRGSAASDLGIAVDDELRISPK